MPQAVAVVADEDDQRIIETELLQVVQHQTDVAVEKLYRGVIRGDDALLFALGQIAKDGGDLPVILRANLGYRQLSWIVPAAKLHRKMKRRVRLGEAEHQEK